MTKRRTPAARSLSPGPAATEALMAGLSRRLQSQEFESMDDVNAFLGQHLNLGSLPASAPTTPVERAQALIYEALESSNTKRRLKLARQAIDLSPDCADAYVLLAEESATPRDARELLEEAVRAGARVLGSEMDVLIAEGHMWLAMESRPYLRARMALAALCWTMGDRPAAIEHAQESLRMNPNDNQGIRYVLLSWLLHAGSLRAVDELLAAYPDDGAAAWQYDRALHAYRVNGPGSAAASALRAARRANAHVPDLLLGRTELPEQLPDYVGWGDASEAEAYAGMSLVLWLDTPGATEWLAEKSLGGEKAAAQSRTSKTRPRSREVQ